MRAPVVWSRRPRRWMRRAVAFDTDSVTGDVIRCRTRRTSVLGCWWMSRTITTTHWTSPSTPISHLPSGVIPISWSIVSSRLHSVGISVRLHRMYEMHTIAVDDPVAWCVCQSVMRLHPAKVAERIEVLPFDGDSWGRKELYIKQESRFPPRIRCGHRQITCCSLSEREKRTCPLQANVKVFKLNFWWRFFGARVYVHIQEVGKISGLRGLLKPSRKKLKAVFSTVFVFSLVCWLPFLWFLGCIERMRCRDCSYQCSCPSVFLSVTRLHSTLLCKMGELIDVLFGLKTFRGPRNIVLDWSLSSALVRWRRVH